MGVPRKSIEKMAVIGKNHQVICITHLAQIAAMADRHYMIEKLYQIRQQKRLSVDWMKKNLWTNYLEFLAVRKIADAVADNAREMKQLAKED